jgi:hypothetical protein
VPLDSSLLMGDPYSYFYLTPIFPHHYYYSKFE